MQSNSIEHFAPIIRSLSSAELQGEHSLNDKLRVRQNGTIEVCYAPFEYVNPKARSRTKQLKKHTGIGEYAEDLGARAERRRAKKRHAISWLDERCLRTGSPGRSK